MAQDRGLARRVGRRMVALGIRQRDIIAKTGLSQAAVNHICTGRVNTVQAPVIFKLAEALECDAKWLATGEK